MSAGLARRRRPDLSPDGPRVTRPLPNVQSPEHAILTTILRCVTETCVLRRSAGISGFSSRLLSSFSDVSLSVGAGKSTLWVHCSSWVQWTVTGLVIPVIGMWNTPKPLCAARLCRTMISDQLVRFRRDVNFVCPPPASPPPPAGCSWLIISNRLQQGGWRRGTRCYCRTQTPPLPTQFDWKRMCRLDVIQGAFPCISVYVTAQQPVQALQAVLIFGLEL